MEITIDTTLEFRPSLQQPDPICFHSIHFGKSAYSLGQYAFQKERTKKGQWFGWIHTNSNEYYQSAKTEQELRDKFQTFFDEFISQGAKQ